MARKRRRRKRSGSVPGPTYRSQAVRRSLSRGSGFFAAPLGGSILRRSRKRAKRLGRLIVPHRPRKKRGDVGGRRPHRAGGLGGRPPNFDVLEVTRWPEPIADGSLHRQVRDRPVCKPRPQDNRSKGGNSRKFIPWCNSRRKR